MVDGMAIQKILANMFYRSAENIEEGHTMNNRKNYLWWKKRCNTDTCPAPSAGVLRNRTSRRRIEMNIGDVVAQSALALRDRRVQAQLEL